MNEETKQFIASEIKTHIHDGNFSQRINLFDIFGFIETVSAAPTETPSDFYGQFKIYNGALYFYDFVANVWDSSGGGAGGSFAGTVNGDGTAANLPTGWTSSTSSPGVYTVTHNLGTTAYSVVATSYNNGARFIDVESMTSNTFQVFLFNVTPSGTNSNFNFILNLT